MLRLSVKISFSWFFFFLISLCFFFFFFFFCGWGEGGTCPVCLFGKIEMTRDVVWFKKMLEMFVISKTVVDFTSSDVGS